MVRISFGPPEGHFCSRPVSVDLLVLSGPWKHGQSGLVCAVVFMAMKQKRTANARFAECVVLFVIFTGLASLQGM
jgi:hypothetical protein